MVIERVIIATHNHGKLAEWRTLLADWPGFVRGAAELGLPVIEETADDYEGNALLKARAVHERTGEWALGDDTGLEIDAWNGAPGLGTARWAENLGGWPRALETLADRLDLRTGHRAPATAVCALALVRPQRPPITSLVRLPGHLTWPLEETLGSSGFDAVFVPDQGQTMNTDGVLLHRRLALAALEAFGIP